MDQPDFECVISFVDFDSLKKGRKEPRAVIVPDF